MRQLAEIVVGWPIVASLALALTARGWRGGRRRGAVDEALHELRRPLQSLVLASEAGGAAGVVGGSAALASQALDRLERELNGRTPPRRPRLLAPRPVLEAAVRRWKSRASLAGGSLELRWRLGEVLVAVDGFELAQALDNLIVNAIEHGGPAIVVEVTGERDMLCVAVTDSGRASRPPERRETPAESIARLRGRRRRGHGLVVVRRFAAWHGGRFSLHRSAQGSRAVVELPLARAQDRSE